MKCCWLDEDGYVPPIQIILQPPGISEKSVIHQHTSDLVADLKAEYGDGGKLYRVVLKSQVHQYLVIEWRFSMDNHTGTGNNSGLRLEDVVDEGIKDTQVIAEKMSSQNINLDR